MVWVPLTNNLYLRTGRSESRRHTLRIHRSLLPQMAAGQVDEHILEARLSRGEVQELRTVLCDRIKQRRNCQVRLAHRQADQAIVVTHGLHARQSPPGAEGRTVAGVAASLKLHHVMP